VLCVLALSLAGCRQEALLHKLDEKQANEVVDALLRNRIDAKKADEGKGMFRVDVSYSDFPQAVEVITQYALPSGVRTQVSTAFPADALVSTPLGERARLYSAIEQRLEESLAAFQGVRQARVNVSYMLSQLSSDANSMAASSGIRLSALLTTEPGVDEVALVQSTKRFLRNTFPKVEYDDISVITTPMVAQRYLAGPPPRSLPTGGWVWLALAAALVAGAGFAWRHLWARWGAGWVKRLRRNKAHVTTV
jgi:type III secretion protein J